MTPYIQLKIVDHYCTFNYLLGYRDDEYADLNPEDYTPNMSVYCPFHENTESKAAKLYAPDSQSDCEKLYCFSENKLYYPHNLLTAPFNTKNHIFKGIVPFTLDYVYNRIWNALSEQEKKYWESLTETQEHEKTCIYSSEYAQYRENKITLFELLNIMQQR